MTERKPDGGCAFPITESMDDNSARASSYGMSLRDYFAAHAPITILDAVKAQPEGEETFRQVFARLAVMRYWYADAMLAERSKS